MIEKIKSEISKIKVHNEGHLTSKHKPLLLIFKSILDGRKSPSFMYEEIDKPLELLLENNKISRTDSKSTYYPFYYLSSSLLWSTNITLKKGETPKKTHVRGKFGTFNEEMFHYLTEHPTEILKLIDLVIELFWEAKVRDKVKASLNLPK